MRDTTMVHKFRWQRDTANYRVFSTQLSQSRVGYVYFPKALLAAGPVPLEIDIIVGARTEHVCNCPNCPHHNPTRNVYDA